MLKKCWGIILWGILFMALGWGLFNLEIYYRYIVIGRERAFSQDVPEYLMKLKKLQSVIENKKLQERLPEIQKEFYSRLSDYDKSLIQASRPENILYFPILGAFYILAAFGLICKKEISRKFIKLLTIISTLGSFYFSYILLNMLNKAVSLINIAGGIDCFLERTNPINLCNSYFRVGELKFNIIEFWLPVIPWLLFTIVVIWYFSREKIKEQFR